MNKENLKAYLAEKKRMTDEYNDKAMEIADLLVGFLKETGKLEIQEGRLPLYLSVDNPPEYVQSLRASMDGEDAIITVYSVREEGVEFSLKYEVADTCIVPAVNEIFDYFNYVELYHSNNKE